eukprot:1331031-Amorphochlora_amoeboformis.AAC.1
MTTALSKKGSPLLIPTCHAKSNYATYNDALIFPSTCRSCQRRSLLRSGLEPHPLGCPGMPPQTWRSLLHSLGKSIRQWLVHLDMYSSLYALHCKLSWLVVVSVVDSRTR